MNDMTAFELKLAASLERHLGERRPVDARSIAASAMSTTAGQAIPLGRRWPRVFGGERSGRRMQSLAWVVMATALLLAALALAFLAGQQPPQPVLPLPSPTLSPTSAATATMPASPRPSLVPSDGPFSSVVLRSTGQARSGLDVIVIEPDGSERVVRQLSTADAALVDLFQGHPLHLHDYGLVSAGGWLAASLDVDPPSGAEDNAQYAFYDLSDPSTPPWAVAFWGGTSGVWGPNGLFAAPSSVNQSVSGMQIIDPDSHAITRMGAHMLGGGPTIFWAADGSGLLGFALPEILGIFPTDGGLPTPGVSAIADKVGARQFGLNGLAICHPDPKALFFGEHEPVCLDSGVATQTVDNQVVTWADASLLGGEVTGASFAADRQTIWAISWNEASAQPISIVRIEQPQSPILATVINRSDVPIPSSSPQLAGLAPDDSTIVLRQLDQNDQEVLLVVPMDGSSPSAHAGQLAGFVPASLADTWPTVELP